MTAIETPCTKICVLEPASGFAAAAAAPSTKSPRWSALVDGERRRIMALLPERLAAIGKRARAPAGASLKDCLRCAAACSGFC